MDLKIDEFWTHQSLDLLSRNRSTVSWRVKFVDLGEIHSYTSLLLDNSKFHMHYFILFGTRKVMVTTISFFPCISVQ